MQTDGSYKMHTHIYTYSNETLRRLRLAPLFASHEVKRSFFSVIGYLALDQRCDQRGDHLKNSYLGDRLCLSRSTWRSPR